MIRIVKNVLFVVALIFCIACRKNVDLKYVTYELDTLSEVNVLDFDSLSGSDHEMIQLAINYASDNGKDVVFVPAGIYEIDAAGVNGERGIALKNGLTLKLHENAVLKAIPNNSAGYSIIRVHNVSNVKITGGTIEGDRKTHLGTTGEWGMGIEVKTSSNVEIYNTLIKNCWGDGIYIGGTSPSLNVKMEMVTCDSNRRQGISVAYGDGIFLKNSIMSNTRGHAPQAGIDLEPNVGQYVTNVEIVNSSFLKNTGPGIFAFAGTGKVSNVLIKDCLSDNNSHAGININGGNSIGGNKNLKNVSIFNVTIKRNPLDGLIVNGTDHLSIDSLTIIDSRQKALTIKNSKNVLVNFFELDDVRLQAVVISNSDSLVFKKGNIGNLRSNTDGVFVSNSRSLSFSNVFVNGGARGVVGQNVKYFMLDSLNLSNQALYGVKIDSASNSKILNSKFEYIAQYPVHMLNALDNLIQVNQFTGNCFYTHNTYAQVFIGGISSNNTISNNTVQNGSHSNKSKYGIWLAVNTYANSVTSNLIDPISFSVSAVFDESGNNIIY